MTAAIDSLPREPETRSAMGNRVKVLYVDTYTTTNSGAATSSSDAIGYGITSSGAIQRELAAQGMDVSVLRVPVDPRTPPERRRVGWTAANPPAILQALSVRVPDVIFVFHAFVVSTAEIRRMLFDLGLNIPIVGYTHGSHWDHTDTFRADRYPGLEFLDLANLVAMDRVLVGSAYLRQTLAESVGRLNPGVADRLVSTVRCVGLPLDTHLIDRYRASTSTGRRTIVFNHAPIRSKDPDLFVHSMIEVLDRTDAEVLFTRRFSDDAPGATRIAELCDKFGDRVRLGADLPIADYYGSLWRSAIQVSTASHESLGIATLEAMYTENCCVLPRSGNYPDLCDDNADVLYEPGDEPELVRRIVGFCRDEARRCRVATTLAAKAQNYTSARVVDAIVHSIEEVLTRPAEIR